MLRTSTALKTPQALADSGLIKAAQSKALEPVAQRYAVSVTAEIAALIDPGDPADPIARQFIPDIAELHNAPGERSDPIGDGAHSSLPGLVHRHRDRVLLMPVKACPVYCRFCFRRESVGPGHESMLSPDALERAFAYIAAHPEIWEVIVTGGDPFILSPRRAGELAARISEIAHVRTLRWHTRVPVVDPSRITDALLGAIRHKSGATFVALHANHPREFTPAAREAIARIVDCGIPMVSQSVLLAGVNDDIEILAALMRSFVENRIKPYYLHHPDLAPGTGHFRVSIERGQELMRALAARVSGLCVPQYVLDIPGGYAKARIAQSDVADGRIRDHDGHWHKYP